MPDWAEWALVIAVVILYVRQSLLRDEARAKTRELQREVTRLDQEIREGWSRCGHLEGYVDTMARHIIESDPAPEHYDAVVAAAKRWYEWRNEQTQKGDIAERMHR